MDLPAEQTKTFCHQLAQLEEKHMPFITSPERLGLERGLIRGIEGLLRVRFAEAGLRLLPEIRQIDDPDKLEQILKAIESGAALEELPRIWAA